MFDLHKAPDWSEQLDRIEASLDGHSFLAFKHLRELARREIERRSVEEQLIAETDRMNRLFASELRDWG